MVKNFNRLWIMVALAVAMLATSIYFGNPYLNVLIFGIGGAIYCILGAWITDTIKDCEQVWFDFVLYKIFRCNPEEVNAPFEDEDE